ncbi:hypothetical protein BJ982_002978 [Sphaerisporangium siamense]|uniref:Uncharacterized protein n=1 Tax=Sphaerisporangium siamense TaxID=795645 RepID=A0A7W7D7I8_9ACTN|nr:hypothetical protein [Sphaerisporangium siamense]
MCQYVRPPRTAPGRLLPATPGRPAAPARPRPAVSDHGSGARPLRNIPPPQRSAADPLSFRAHPTTCGAIAPRKNAHTRDHRAGGFSRGTDRASPVLWTAFPTPLVRARSGSGPQGRDLRDSDRHYARSNVGDSGNTGIPDIGGRRSRAPFESTVKWYRRRPHGHPENLPDNARATLPGKAERWRRREAASGKPSSMFLFRVLRNVRRRIQGRIRDRAGPPFPARRPRVPRRTRPGPFRLNHARRGPDSRGMPAEPSSDSCEPPRESTREWPLITGRIHEDT